MESKKSNVFNVQHLLIPTYTIGVPVLEEENHYSYIIWNRRTFPSLGVHLEYVTFLTKRINRWLGTESDGEAEAILHKK